MTATESDGTPSGFWRRLQNAGIEPDDSEELRLNKSLLMLATGLASVGIILWVAIYSILGPQFSYTVPFAFQLLLAGNMLLYIMSRNFEFFRISQLGLFLFLPFVAQWLGGTLITTSGVLLWALLAPVGAILCIGVSQSVGWFIAWVVLTAVSGVVDLYLVDYSLVAQKASVPVRTTLVFFTLNFISVSTIIYMLLRLSIAEKRKAQKSLEQAHRQILIEQERSEKLLLNILPAPIADRLKSSDKTIADGFADVTVMFADIVNFTQVATNMSPSQVFAMLNRIFSAFDELAEQHGWKKSRPSAMPTWSPAASMRKSTTIRPPSPTWRLPCATCCAATFRSMLRTWKSASASAPARSSPACWARRSSSTISGATPSTSPAASPPKASPA
jgi:adenylate cyclase